MYEVEAPDPSNPSVVRLLPRERGDDGEVLYLMVERGEMRGAYVSEPVRGSADGVLWRRPPLGSSTASVMVDARAGDHLDVSAPHFLSLHLSPVAREGSPGYEEGRALDEELVETRGRFRCRCRPLRPRAASWCQGCAVPCTMSAWRWKRRTGVWCFGSCRRAPGATTACTAPAAW